MEEWKEYKLGEISDIQTGPFGSQLHQKDYVPLGTPCIMPTNIGNRLNIDTTNIAHIKSEDVIRLQHHCVKEGDIIYSRRGDIEKCAYILPVNEGWLCGTGCLRIRVKDNDVNSRFVAYQLSTCECKKWIVGNAVGSTMLNLNTSILKELPLRLPSKNEQDRLVNILKSLDDKIEVNRRINDNLEQQAQALFKSWFVDFEPFRDQPFVESELGMIPEGWSVENIYEYIDVIYGAPYKSTLFNDNKDGLPLIRIRDLKTNAPQFYTPEVLPNTEYINAGDIVAGMDAEFIPYVWLGEKGVLNQRCCKFKGKNEAISNYYILFLIKPELEYVQSYKTGTTVSHLGKSDIDRFRFITPPLDVVLTFSEKINAMKQVVVSRAKESRRLAQLRDTLLPRLMSGEIKVNEIKEIDNGY
jgi:type I restriction enzyme S subunit